MRKLNDIKYKELMVLLTWVKGVEMARALETDKTKITDIYTSLMYGSNFEWDALLYKATDMDYSGSGETVADIPDSDFEEIFSLALGLFKKEDFVKIEEKMKAVGNSDLSVELGQSMGFEMTNELVQLELAKLYAYKDIIDRIFITYSFLSPELEEKQLIILTEELNKKIRNEEYEKCTILQEKINNIKKGTII